MKSSARLVMLAKGLYSVKKKGGTKKKGAKKKGGKKKRGPVKAF